MDYEAKKRNEIMHYAEVESLHPESLPDFLAYWGKLWQPILDAAGFLPDENMFLTSLRTQCLAKRDRTVKVVSFGTGTSDNEIAIANSLIEEGLTNFAIECVEFNPVLCEQVRVTLAESGLDRFISVTTQDINTWQPNDRYDMVMAAWCLHHFVELEYLFDQVHASLVDDGVFVTAEAMGRNGHQRWDEVWPILTPLWNNVPDKYKHNHQLGTWDIASPWDDDCAAGTFEGVRAQDILPLLMERFHFHQFAPHSNLAEKFFEKNYGPNYDQNNAEDRELAERVNALDELLIDSGVITPCRMYVVMGKQPIANPKFYRHWTPEFVVRDPEQQIHDRSTRRQFTLRQPALTVATQTAAMPSTSVVMVVRNSLAQTLQAIQSARLNTPNDTEIIVVDNGSTDGSVAFLQSTRSDIEVVTLSPAIANDDAWEHGLRACKGNLVIFLSTDIVLQEGWLDEPARMADSEQNIAISPTLINEQGIRRTSEGFNSLNGVCLVVDSRTLQADQQMQARVSTRSVVGFGATNSQILSNSGGLNG